MNILDEIIEYKYKEVNDRKSLFPIKLLERSLFFESKTISLQKYVLRNDKSGIIAEIKRKSPSRGIINANVDVERTSIGYMQAGASALSILTDNKYFGGKNEDLSIARKYNFCPILRKEFIVDEYQVIEAKSIGADAVLLIAAALKPTRLKQLAKLAKQLSLEVLLEIHDENDLELGLNEYIDIVGVNNRDLKTFQVDINNSLKLAHKIPDSITRISESGLNRPQDIVTLKQHGYTGFLMGETFMRSSRPEKACSRFISVIKSLEEKVYA